MFKEFEIPAIVRQKIKISAKVQSAWKSAVWTVKQGQEKFLMAYKATIDEQIPDWKDRWKNDPGFAQQLAEVEEYISQICRSNGMGLTTFNRYRTAARKALLTGTPFKFAAQNFTIAEAKAISEGGEEVARQIRREKNLNHAASMVAKHATILPIPEPGANPQDYLDIVSRRLADHMALVKERFGDDVCSQLVKAIMPDSSPA